MRPFIAFICGGAVGSLFPDQHAVTPFLVTFLIVWAGLNIWSPGRCPHCGRGVRFRAAVCAHCGREVFE